MDPRLANAARLGDLTQLSALLEEDPLILEKVALSCISETPMHIAALAGKTDFLKQIIELKPSFALELNKDGFSPLHIASATGNLEAVREILKLGPDLCLIKDKKGRIPLHLAAIKGRVEVINDLISCCPDAAKEVTAWGETALHLAVKNSQFQALKVLVEKFNDMDFGEVLNAKDKEGNNIFQVAASTKQALVLEFLKKYQSKSDMEVEIVEVNSKDQSDMPKIAAPNSCGTAKFFVKKNSQKRDQSKEAEEDKKVQAEEEKKMQDLAQVVASLIATVTYEAGLSPPATIWRQGMKLGSKCFSSTKTSFLESENRCPGIAFYFFMAFNAAGFFASVFLIILYKRTTHVYGLLVTALGSMIISYITLSVAMSPEPLSLFIIYFTTLIIFAYSLLTVELLYNFFASIASICPPVGKVVSKAKATIERKKKSSSQANVSEGVA